MREPVEMSAFRFAPVSPPPEFAKTEPHSRGDLCQRRRAIQDSHEFCFALFFCALPKAPRGARHRLAPGPLPVV